jgi:dTDP-L-rhamnose 4-epimerase
MAHALSAAMRPPGPAPQVTGGWRVGDVRHLVASPAKAAARLGFAAALTFASGMAELAHAAGDNLPAPARG